MATKRVTTAFAAIGVVGALLLVPAVGAQAAENCGRTSTITSTNTTLYNNACYQVKAHIRRLNSTTGTVSTYSSSYQFNTASVSASVYYLYDHRGQVSDGAYSYAWYLIK